MYNVINWDSHIHIRYTRNCWQNTVWHPVCQIIQNFSQTAGQVAHKIYLSCVGICGDLCMLVWIITTFWTQPADRFASKVGTSYAYSTSDWSGGWATFDTLLTSVQISKLQSHWFSSYDMIIFSVHFQIGLYCLTRLSRLLVLIMRSLLTSSKVQSHWFSSYDMIILFTVPFQIGLYCLTRPNRFLALITRSLLKHSVQVHVSTILTNRSTLQR